MTEDLGAIDETYLRHVTELGETRQVVACEDICNRLGLKLVAKGLLADEISLPGRILAVGELVASLSERQPVTTLATILKAQTGRLDPAVVSAMLGLLRRLPDGGSAPDPRIESLQSDLDTALGCLDDWAAGQDTPHPAAALLTARMSTLEAILLRAGLNFVSPAELVAALRDDPQSLAETEVIAREAWFQLSETLRELRRRWPDLALEDAAAPVRAWMEKAESALRH